MVENFFIGPFEKQGFEVLYALEFAHSMFYGTNKSIPANLKEFKECLDSFRDQILQFNPDYFLADAGFFNDMLMRAGNIVRRRVAIMLENFIKELNVKGIRTIVICVDDPRQHIVGRYYLGLSGIRNAFQAVATHTMQSELEQRNHGQKVIFFPNYVRMPFEKPVRGIKDSLLEDKIRNSVFNFDLFFVGAMPYRRKAFFWRLSKKFRSLDYFFGSKDFFFTSRKKIDFDILNKFHLNEIYKRARINIVYGSQNDFHFNKTWGVTDRVFNIAYCHGFFLCDYRKHFIDLFDVDPDLYTFKTFNECCQKIRLYLKDDALREKLLEKFYKQVLERHTIDKRVEGFVADLKKYGGNCQNGQV